MGDDGAALRGLQGRGGPAVLPRSFLAARSPDRAGRCARGVQCRTGSAASISRRRWREFWIVSGSGAARSSAACSGRGSTASCLPRPRPIICIIRAMIGSRRCCGGPSARAVARAEDTGAAIDVVALAAVRATREAQVAARPRKTALDPRHARCRRDRQWRGFRRQHRGRDLSGRSARRSGRAVQGRSRVSRPLQRSGRKDRFSLSALSPAAARTRRRGRTRAASHPP